MANKTYEQELKDLIERQKKVNQRFKRDSEEDRILIAAIQQIDANIDEQLIIDAINQCRIDLTRCVFSRLGLLGDADGNIRNRSN
jgi:hypothetical protein